MRALADPYGSFLPSLIFHDIRDRLHGRRAAANARWGRLSRPAHHGKLIWICSGASRNSVRLGVELAQAIVAKRPDVAVALTYEVEFRELLEPLASVARISCDYGPADYVGSIDAIWRTLTPFALILAGVSPRRNLLGVASIARHALLVAPPQAVTGHFERVYPTHCAPCPGATSAQAADLDTLLAEVRIEPRLARAIGAQRRLWWWHGNDAQQALRFAALFRGHVPGDLLVMSGPLCGALSREKGGIRLLSRWQDEPIDGDILLLADDARWFAALAFCAAGAHFATSEPDALWQALAGGAYVSTSGDVNVASPHLTSSVGLLENENDVALRWSALRADPLKARIARDASRRAFTAERRLAQDAIADLMNRVLEWH